MVDANKLLLVILKSVFIFLDSPYGFVFLATSIKRIPITTKTTP
jgi:hypothetical protein